MPTAMDLIELFDSFFVSGVAQDENGDVIRVDDDWDAESWTVFGSPQNGGPIAAIQENFEFREEAELALSQLY